ncbi:hypothetical protein JNUCC0626_48340 [Lentzea sp. JNUCC 0626]|uniref:hypothetical protein n=1 Tax=Lentzea sp. JNUCC 0626 TaxID=3367513 RepID=UPI003749B62D
MLRKREHPTVLFGDSTGSSKRLGHLTDHHQGSEDVKSGIWSASVESLWGPVMSAAQTSDYGSRVAFTKRVIKELFGSASRCAFPGCCEKLVVCERGVSVINVDIAHIRSASRHGPRHDENYPVEWLDQARNLLLLCTKHHRLVDSGCVEDSLYPVAELEIWKRDQAAEDVGWALVADRGEEALRFYEGFALRVDGEPEFGRWRPDVDLAGSPSSQGGGAAGFANVAGDPVSVAAAWSVAQLINGFASNAVVPPEPASAFGATIAAFLLDDAAGFGARMRRLEFCCHTDPFEAMLTAILYGAAAVRLWEMAADWETGVLRDSWIAAGVTIPYVADIVVAARFGEEDHDPLPGHPDDQRKVAMNLGQVTAMTLQLAADHQLLPLVSVVQDLLIGVQRVPGDV